MYVFCLHEGLHVPVDTQQFPKGIVGGFEFTVFKEVWKNDTRGHGHMFASAKRKHQK